MKAPRFWFRPASWQATLLAPLGWLYGALAADQLCRRAARAHAARVPVVSVGNLTVGGSGKTPLIAFLAAHFSKTRKVAIVSRGYGGSLKGPHRVNPKADTAAMVGDEPLLLARRFPKVAVWVSRARVDGVAQAEKAGATLILLDDGFQRRDVARDIDLVTIDGATALGNARVLPAGPLRESAKALARATAAVVMNGPLKGKLPVPAYALALGSALPPALKGKRVVAFAGLGHPEKFFHAIAAAGATLAATVPFPDHHAYTKADLARLKALAARHNATLACTAKDAVKLPPAFATVIAETLTGPDTAKLIGMIERKLAKPL